MRKDWAWSRIDFLHSIRMDPCCIYSRRFSGVWGQLFALVCNRYADPSCTNWGVDESSCQIQISLFHRATMVSDSSPFPNLFSRAVKDLIFKVRPRPLHPRSEGSHTYGIWSKCTWGFARRWKDQAGLWKRLFHKSYLSTRMLWPTSNYYVCSCFACVEESHSGTLCKMLRNIFILVLCCWITLGYFLGKDGYRAYTWYP